MQNVVQSQESKLFCYFDPNFCYYQTFKIVFIYLLMSFSNWSQKMSETYLVNFFMDLNYSISPEYDYVLLLAFPYLFIISFA